MDNNQAIATANASAKERADAAVQGDSGYTAPDVSKIEAPATPLKTPPRTTVGAIEEYTSITPEYIEAQRALQEKAANQGQVGEDLYSQMLGLGTKGAATIKAEEAAGIGELSTGLTEVENEIAQKALAFRRERERIETAGGSKAQVDTILAEVGRKQNRELADLETIRAARSNSLTNAQNLVDRKIELEFGDKIADIEALKFLYNENKETLNKEDERLFQQTIKREERGFEVAKSKFVQLENEKAKYLTNAAQAGADNNTLKTIQAAQSLDELYTMPGIQSYALSAMDKLELQAKKQSIYSSAVSTRLALANAGDPTAIKELGFDPREVAEPEKLDATTKRQLTEQVNGSDELLALAKDYRNLVAEYGYTNQVTGNAKVLGQIDSLRAQMTAAYKKAEQLGTLDTGVLNLMAQVIGEKPVSSIVGWGEEGNVFTNITGRKSRRVVEAMDQLIETTESKKARAQLQLGIDPLLDAQLSPEESAELNAQFGVPTTTTKFDPNSFYK